jgi:hypothetical protein
MLQSTLFFIVALFVEAASAAETKPSSVLASRNDLSISFLESVFTDCSPLAECAPTYVHPGALYSVVRCYFALVHLFVFFSSYHSKAENDFLDKATKGKTKTDKQAVKEAMKKECCRAANSFTVELKENSASANQKTHLGGKKAGKLGKCKQEKGVWQVSTTPA